MIIPLYIVLAIFLIIHIKHKMIIPVLLVVWLCAFSVMEHFAVNSPTYRFEYMREDKNEYICISSSGKNTLVDISDGSSGDLYEASKRATLLGYREIETVLLTHIHKRHINSLCKIASETMVRNVILPKPIKESEHSIYESIKYEMELLGVNVSEYSNGEKIGLLNGFEVSAKRIYKSRSTHPAIFIEFSGNLDAVYIGSSYLEYDDEMINGDKVFIGSHGPKCKNEFIIYPKNGAFVSIATKELTELLKISGKGDFKIINSVESVIFCGENK